MDADANHQDNHAQSHQNQEPILQLRALLRNMPGLEELRAAMEELQREHMAAASEAQAQAPGGAPAASVTNGNPPPPPPPLPPALLRDLAEIEEFRAAIEQAQREDIAAFEAQAQAPGGAPATSVTSGNPPPPPPPPPSPPLSPPLLRNLAEIEEFRAAIEQGQHENMAAAFTPGGGPAASVSNGNPPPRPPPPPPLIRDLAEIEELRAAIEQAHSEDMAAAFEAQAQAPSGTPAASVTNGNPPPPPPLPPTLLWDLAEIEEFRAAIEQAQREDMAAAIEAQAQAPGDAPAASVTNGFPPPPPPPQHGVALAAPTDNGYPPPRRRYLATDRGFIIDFGTDSDTDVDEVNDVPVEP